MTASGLRRGRPAPVRGTLTPSMTSSDTVESLTLPGVTTTARGRPRPSQARWTLVVSPPRDRPSAWPAVAHAGSSSSSPDAAPFCGLRRRAGGLGWSWSRPKPSISRFRRDRPGPGPAPAGGPRCRPPPSGRTAHRPSAMAHSVPAGHAMAHRSVTPQHPVDHLPVIQPRTPSPVNTGQQRRYPLPCRIRQLTTTHHEINYQTGPSRSVRTEHVDTHAEERVSDAPQQKSYPANR